MRMEWMQRDWRKRHRRDAGTRASAQGTPIPEIRRGSARLSCFVICVLCLVGTVGAGQEAEPSGTLGDAAEIRRDLDEILQQPEFRRVRVKEDGAAGDSPEWVKWLNEKISKFIDWLWEKLRRGGEKMAGWGAFYQMLAYTALATVCALIIWLVVKAFVRWQERQYLDPQRRARFEEGETEIPPGDLPADEYVRRAMELVGQGLFREAVGQLLLGGMSHAERSGWIRFRRGLTHRDYLRALRGRAVPHQSFRAMVGIYEPICFGRRPAAEPQYQAAREHYRVGFEVGVNSVGAGGQGMAGAGDGA